MVGVSAAPARQAMSIVEERRDSVTHTQHLKAFKFMSTNSLIHISTLVKKLIYDIFNQVVSILKNKLFSAQLFIPFCADFLILIICL